MKPVNRTQGMMIFPSNGHDTAITDTSDEQVLSVDPFRCRLWHLHDRLEESLCERACRAEIDSISRLGQIVPALGRRVSDDPDHDYELIYGARRWFAARHLAVPLRIQLCTLGDREALIAMDIENRQRCDLSPYERGMSYARWLQREIFSSQEEIARALGISTSAVSRLLKLARLPSIVVASFATPADMLENWGVALWEASIDRRRRPRLIRRARTLAAEARSRVPQDVYRELMAATRTLPRRQESTRDTIIRSDAGQPLFRIRRRAQGLTLVLPPRLAYEKIQSLTRMIEKTLAEMNAEQPPRASTGTDSSTDA
jgi:ParB family transcriptional regulator, chromosome partitioning protein